jgi:hypothetical protein
MKQKAFVGIKFLLSGIYNFDLLEQKIALRLEGLATGLELFTEKAFLNFQIIMTIGWAP